MINPTNLKPEELLLENIWAMPEWLSMPYHLIKVKLADSSTLFLAANDVAYFAAEVLASDESGVSIEAHLVAQVVPAIVEHPERLVEIVARMPFSLLRALQQNACWRSPAVYAEKFWPNHANISLWCTDSVEF